MIYKVIRHQLQLFLFLNHNLLTCLKMNLKMVWFKKVK